MALVSDEAQRCSDLLPTGHCSVSPCPGTGPVPAAATSQPSASGEQQDLAWPQAAGNTPHTGIRIGIVIHGITGEMASAKMSQPWPWHIAQGPPCKSPSGTAVGASCAGRVSQRRGAQRCVPSLLSFGDRPAGTLLAGPGCGVVCTAEGSALQSISPAC